MCSTIGLKLIFRFSRACSSCWRRERQVLGSLGELELRYRYNVLLLEWNRILYYVHYYCINTVFRTSSSKLTWVDWSTFIELKQVIYWINSSFSNGDQIKLFFFQNNYIIMMVRLAPQGFFLKFNLIKSGVSFTKLHVFMQFFNGKHWFYKIRFQKNSLRGISIINIII